MKAAVRSVIRGAACALVLMAIGACAATKAGGLSPSVTAATVHEPLGPSRTSVCVREYGPENADAILLVHGNGASAPRDFDAIVPALARSFRVIAVELPGFGSSPAPATPYSPDDYTQVLVEVLERRKLGEAHVIGHSMGGAIALLFASQHPGRVRRLALFDVAGVLYFREYAQSIVAGKLAQRGDGLDLFRGLAHGLLRVLSKPFARTELQDLPLRDSATLKFIDYDFGHALRAIELPVFLGWGRHDHVAPERTREALRFWLRPVETVLYEKSGHVPMRSEPSAVARDLNGFFSSRDARDANAIRASARAEPLKSYSCRREHGLVLEGDFDRIELDRCRDVKLINVRARALRAVRSTLEARRVEIEGSDVAVSLSRSRVVWTGGRIRAPIGIEAAGARLNLAAVLVEASREGIVTLSPSHMVASASGVRAADRPLAPLHGRYRLQRNAAAPPRDALASAPAELTRREQASASVPE